LLVFIKIPQDIIAPYPNKIINIHPVSSPKYGGKGMYGNECSQNTVMNSEKKYSNNPLRK
jgi:phosphoribosylglycinamide formyltransferase-1